MTGSSLRSLLRPAPLGALAILLACLLGPALVPYAPTLQLPDGLSPLGAPLPPGPAHWLGTDELGRDVGARLLAGGRTSLLIAGAATALAGLLGVGVGLVAGFRGGWPDAALMRLTDVVMAFPGLLLAIALASVLPPGPVAVALTLGLVGWTSLARLVRGRVLQIREREFIEAARAGGAGAGRILRRHVWPNVAPLALALLVLKLADMLLLEAALGFLGLGVAPPEPSWGALVAEGRGAFYTAPWLGLPAGAAIALTVLAVNGLIDRRRAQG